MNKKIETIDVLASDGSLTHSVATIDEVNKKGLWHNAVHALILTPKGRMVVQKRSSTIRTYPGLLELGVGGLVNSGETCAAAIRREIKEELGLSVDKNNIKLLAVTRWNRWHPHNQTRTKTFLHTYVVHLPEEKPTFMYQVQETKQAFVLSHANAKRLIAKHSLRSFGRLAPMFAYWKYYLALSQAYLHPTILIVCRGNKFRSKLAQAYMRSRKVPYVHIVSSGIDVALDTRPNTLPYTRRIMQKNNLYRYAQKRRYQTNQTQLDAADLIVFVSKTVQNDAIRRYNVDMNKVIIWDIGDIVQKDLTLPKAKQLSMVNHLYSDIKKATNELIKELPSRFPQINR